MGNLFITTATSTTGPISFMAIRSSHVFNILKVESGAKQAPSILFESTINAHHGLETYICLVHCHFVEYGMDALFYIVTLNVSWVNILDRNSQFMCEEVHKQTMALLAANNSCTKSCPSEGCNVFDVQNLKFLQLSSLLQSPQHSAVKFLPRLAKTLTMVQLFGCMLWVWYSPLTKEEPRCFKNRTQV